MQDRCGNKYYRHRRTRKYVGLRNVTIIVLAIILAVIAGASWLFIHDSAEEKSVYGQIKSSGYTGSQEQWIASLAGEDLGDPDAPTAYELACDKGYSGSFGNWIETITGAESKDVRKTAYSVACENGYTGSLSEWLTHIAYRPDKLGKSKNSSKKTEYELACQFGYTGTFIEWVVSVSHEEMF